MDTKWLSLKPISVIQQSDHFISTKCSKSMGNDISMACCKTAVAPLLTHWSCCSLAQGHRYTLHPMNYTKYIWYWYLHPRICMQRVWVLIYRVHPTTYATSLIVRFMGPTWDPSGADRTHVGPMNLVIWGVLVLTHRMPSALVPICTQHIPRIMQSVWVSTHGGRDKMAPIFQAIFSNVFFAMKMYEFRLGFHWGLFLRSNQQYSSIGLYNGLVSSRLKATFWTNDG